MAVTEKGGDLTKNGKTVTLILMILSGLQMVLAVFIGFMMHFLVGTQSDIMLFHFNFVGIVGFYSLVAFTAINFLHILFARKGEIEEVKTLFFANFFLLFIPLVFIYVYFASVTINSIIVAILDQQETRWLPVRIIYAVLGLVGMVFTLFVLTPYMILLKRFSDTVDKKGAGKFDKSGKGWYFAMFLGSFSYMASVLYFMIASVFWSSTFGSAAIFSVFEVVASISGIVLFSIILITTRRYLTGRDTLKGLLMIIIHVLQFVHVVCALITLIAGIIYSIVSLAVGDEALQSPTTGVISLIVNILGVPIVGGISAMNIVFFYLATFLNKD